MKNADYRKINNRNCSSSTYHKKDGAAVRAKLKVALREERNEAEKMCFSCRDGENEVPARALFQIKDPDGNERPKRGYLCSDLRIIKVCKEAKP